MAGGATYDPSQHTVSNKAYGVAQAAPTDGRSYYLDMTLFKYRPYAGTAEVLSYLNTDAKRTGHFPIYVSTGTLESDGTFTGGEVKEYWFKDGTADANLVVKQSSGGGGLTTVATYSDLQAAADYGLYEVTASEVNNNELSFYIKNSTGIFWIPTQQIE